MPSVDAPANVLVTGANGFLAVWIVRFLLEQGYRVRGTVRSAAKGDALKSLFVVYGTQFDYVIVEDILKDGAFDEAVKDMSLILHTASPAILSTIPDEVIIPSVKSTISILHSAKKHQDTVRRVVITGSSTCVSWLPQVPEPAVHDESMFNVAATEAVEKGITDPMIIYSAGKTKAEQGAWEFMKENKITAFDLVYLHGTSFFGPSAHPVASITQTSISMQQFYMGVIQGRDEETVLKAGGSWIDVRDIALAHILAAQKEEAGGERIIVSAGDWVWSDLHTAAHTIDPALPSGGVDKEKVYRVRYDASKSKRLLGLQPRSLEETMRDSLAFIKTIPASLIT